MVTSYITLHYLAFKWFSREKKSEKKPRRLQADDGRMLNVNEAKYVRQTILFILKVLHVVTWLLYNKYVSMLVYAHT